MEVSEYRYSMTCARIDGGHEIGQSHVVLLLFALLLLLIIEHNKSNNLLSKGKNNNAAMYLPACT